MPRPKKIPVYRLHKPSGQAIVRLSDNAGRRHDVYLGKFGTTESRTEYARVLKEWEVSGHQLPTERGTTPADLSINELLLAYLDHAESYYVKDGKQTSELHAIRQAIGFVKDLYGSKPARDFGPLNLKVVRQAMIDHKITRKCKHKTIILAEGMCRNNINNQIQRIKRLFSWAVENELVPPATYQALAEVSGLRKGRTEAREKPPVKPAPQAWVDAAIPFMPPMIADMVRVQLLNGARPGEVCIIRPCDLTTTGSEWEYRPSHHKTEHHDRERVIFFGPKAQAILTHYLPLSTTAYLFCPLESERLAQRSPTPAALQERTLDRRKLEARRSLRRCRLPPGHPPSLQAGRRSRLAPNQLRHAAATTIGNAFGLEAAQHVLGHAEPNTTRIYAERNLDLAREVARKIG